VNTNFSVFWSDSTGNWTGYILLLALPVFKVLYLSKEYCLRVFLIVLDTWWVVWKTCQQILERSVMLPCQTLHHVKSKYFKGIEHLKMTFVVFYLYGTKTKIENFCRIDRPMMRILGSVHVSWIVKGFLIYFTYVSSQSNTIGQSCSLSW